MVYHIQNWDDELIEHTQDDVEEDMEMEEENDDGLEDMQEELDIQDMLAILN